MNKFPKEMTSVVGESEKVSHFISMYRALLTFDKKETKLRRHKSTRNRTGKSVPGEGVDKSWKTLQGMKPNMSGMIDAFKKTIEFDHKNRSRSNSTA